MSKMKRRETRAKEYIKLKAGPCGPTMDLSIGKQVIAAARIVGAPSFLKQMA